MKRLTLAIAGSSLLIMSVNAQADIVHADDVITQGSMCIGFDCINGESFGFDTLRLKENNLRIKFEDTSNSASFPAGDWQITVNDEANGGLNKFSIDDVSGGRTPFTIEGNAPTNSLYVDDGGRVGLGTSIPVAELHVVDGDSPTLRLEQDGSSGFTAQTWDLAGNESNFFIRDVTGGSKLPFRIRPGAPTSSIDIAGSGNVGIGTSSPTAPLHVLRNDGSAKVLVQDTNGTTAARTLFALENKGNTKFEIVNTNANNSWAFTNSGSDFRVSLQDSGVVEFSINNAGDAFLAGALTENSDVNAKQSIVPIDSQAILRKIASLPIRQWQYRDAPGVNHVGPMAQDFHAAFGLGASATGISTLDSSGVALAAIQALIAENTELRARLETLEQQQAQMQAVMARMLESQSELQPLQTTLN
jgi:hypothetical protein